ncbi:hypothetical protein [Anaerotignum sp.]
MKPTNKDPFEELLHRTFAADSLPPEDTQQALLAHLEEKEKTAMKILLSSLMRKVTSPKTPPTKD